MPFLPVPPPAVVLKYQPPAAPASNAGAGQSEYETWDADRLFQFGTYLLRSGRNFPRSIQVLEIAAKKQPNNADYHLALGCAYASRFASVAEAARQIKNAAYYEETYPAIRAEWEKNQQNQKSPDYERPAPAPPRPHITPDDARPFTLSPDETRAEMVRLAQKSVAAFDAANKLIPTLPGEKQAEANYLRGWGLWTLRRDGVEQGVISDTSPKESLVKNEPSPASVAAVVVSPGDVTDCFQNSTKYDAKDGKYWQSLGFSFVPDYLDGKTTSTRSTLDFWQGVSPYKKAVIEQSVHAFEQALSAKPHDFDVLYSLALVTAQSMPEVSLSYLEKAAQRQNNNAALWYLFADIQFRQGLVKEGVVSDAATKKAIVSIERGNTSASYQANRLNLPLPFWLRPAWSYREVKGFGDERRLFSSLDSYLRAYMKKEDASDHKEAFLRAAAARMGISLKAINSVADSSVSQANLYDLWQKDNATAVRVLWGIINGYAAYDEVQYSQKARPDAQKALFLERNTRNLQYIKDIDKEVNRSG